jgi:hypothetical protein
LYHDDFFPYFFREGLSNEDCWYGNWDNGKHSRIPQFSMKHTGLETRTHMKVFHPMRSSLPEATTNKCLVAAAEMECRFQTLSEWMLANVLYALPYGTTGFIAKGNLEKTSALSLQCNGVGGLPCQSLCRALSKGAVGLQQVKALHDDGNATIIPGVWTSVIGDSSVCLHFVGRGTNYYFSATTHQFCWFYGWVPHKTEVRMDTSVHGNGTMAELKRLHHSGFSKPEFEHLSHVLFSPKFVKEVVHSYDC